MTSNILKGKRIFVSGGSGVIGKELVLMLHKHGAKIFVGDLKPFPNDFPKSIKYRQGDLNYITKSEIEDFDPQIFFHLAATFERSIETYKFWGDNFHHNVKLSHHLIDLLKDSKNLMKIIFASSYLVYNQDLYTSNEPRKIPRSLTEKDFIYPRNLTGTAKFSHEIELEFINSFKKNTQFISSRIFRVYGKNSKDIVSRWINVLLNKQKIDVYNKENIFDYIYAEDVAEALLRLAKTNFSGTVNIGTGNSQSINYVLNILKKHFPDMRCREIISNTLYESSQSDIALLEKLTDWKPKTSLNKGIPKLIDYYIGQRNDTTSISKLPNVLITSLSKKTPLVFSVKSAINKIGEGILYGGDVNNNCIGKYFVDKFYLMPKTIPINSIKILKYCKNNKIGHIIPTRDGELVFWAENKKLFYKEGINIMISEPTSVKNTIDKFVFYKTCKKLNLPAIITSLEINDLKCKQYVVKERFGAGSKNIGLKLTYNQALKHAKDLVNPIFQPFIKGREVSIDVYVCKNGNVKGAVLRGRNLIIDGESQITTTFRNNKLEKLALIFSKKMKLYGHIILQVLIDKHGKYYIIECNSRFGGASTASLASGLDSFYWFFLENRGVDISDYPFFRNKNDVKQVRFPNDAIF